MLASKRPDVRCRLIEDGDLEAVVDCLRRGFPYRGRAYWTRALDRMSARAPIDDSPRYRYLLEASRGIVGVLLAIYSRHDGPEGDSVRCNLSSYCVDVNYRGYAPLLHSVAVRRREVTYTNVSPAKHTRAGIEALKFRKFCEGQLLFAPILSAARPGARVTPFAAHSLEAALLPDSERDLLAEHAALGCRALLCIDKNGTAHPFVLQRRAAFHRLLPCHQLIYCRSLDEFVAFAGSIGRYLLLRAWPIFIADANGPVKGLVGKYFAGHGPKYFKGPAPPTLGDLSYTELVILGP
jgi:hypothetical protein